MHEAYCAIKLPSFVLDFFKVHIIYGLIDAEITIFGEGNPILPSLLLLNFLHQNICKVCFEITDFSVPCEKAFLYCVINFLPEINPLFTSQWVSVSKVVLVIIFLFHMPVYSIS